MVYRTWWQCSATWTDATSTAGSAGTAGTYRRQDHIDTPAVVAIPGVGAIRGIGRPGRRGVRTATADRALGTHGGCPGAGAIRRGWRSGHDTDGHKRQGKS